MDFERHTAARILIVDDNASNTFLLETLLKRNGFSELVSTTDPFETLALYESFQPDLLLLDLQMPKLDGFDILEALQGMPDRGYFPVLVLTADVRPEAKYRALKGGARDFLTKPFDQAEVLLRVGNLLETRRLHRLLQVQNEVLEERVEERTHQLDLARLETLETLALAAEFRDDATHHHTERVAEISVAVAEELHADVGFIEVLRRAAPLHDIGKIGISDAILLKPGRLTPDEFETMKGHTSIGASILANTQADVLRLGAEIALTHHERWDGDGYPGGLSGEAIPLSGRIVTLADVFDALIHERPYKEAWSEDEALAEIERDKNKKFDPTVTDAFLEAVAR